MEKPDVVAEMYRDFNGVTISQLEEKLASAETREEKLFCRAMINLKLHAVLLSLNCCSTKK